MPARPKKMHFCDIENTHNGLRAKKIPNFWTNFRKNFFVSFPHIYKSSCDNIIFNEFPCILQFQTPVCTIFYLHFLPSNIFGSFFYLDLMARLKLNNLNSRRVEKMCKRANLMNFVPENQCPCHASINLEFNFRTN